MALVIGITGNIGTGKSTVLKMLADLGAQVIDADQLAHDVMAPNGPAYADIVREFGPGILKTGVKGDAELESGPAVAPIDRRKLARIVFASQGARRRSQALHP